MISIDCVKKINIQIPQQVHGAAQHRLNCGNKASIHRPSPQAFTAHISIKHRSNRKSCVRVTAQAAAQEASARLDALEFYPVVNVQGFIQTNVPDGTEATVFAIYDQSKTLQYVGFSKNLRNSLRTVFSRRPDKAHFYKALHLPKLDQQQMLDVRTAWFAENSGPPPGNALAQERAGWQEPASSFSISDRGKSAAAEELLKDLLNRIRLRGCKEEFIPDPELLATGQVDFLAAAEITAEEIERRRLLAIAAVKATRDCTTTIDGETVPFQLFVSRKYKTNGGYMMDIVITCQDKESTHRIVVGKNYYEPQNIEPEVVVERVFAFLLKKKLPRQTEGMLLSSQFPVNYFSVSEAEQFFDDFSDALADITELSGGFWRFNRTQDYGYKGGNESGAQLSSQFLPKWQEKEK